VLLAGFFKNTGQKTGQEFGNYRTIYRTHQDIATVPNEQSLRTEQLLLSSHKSTSWRTKNAQFYILSALFM